MTQHAEALEHQPSPEQIGPVGLPDPEYGWAMPCCGADYDCVCE